MSTKKELFEACESGDLETVHRAIASGVDPEVVTRVYYRETPLLIACRHGHLNIVQFLVDGQRCNLEAKNKYGMTAILYAAWLGHLNIVQFLAEGQRCNLEAKNIYGRTAIHLAARWGRLNIVQFLVDGQHCSLEAKDNDWRTAVHCATEKGHLDIVRFLVDGQHCHLEAKDNDGRTAIHLAARSGHTSVASYLLQHGKCDPNSVTLNGQTPLDMADDPSLIRLLLVHGAKPTSRVPSHLRDNPTDAATNMYIVGNPGAGKSTVIKSLSTGGNALARVKHRFTKVKDVDENTAGIIPHDIESEALGRVTAYDLAGHREFYAGHDALLYSSMRGSPSIILLVIDISEEESKIKDAVQYWIQFISNHTTESGPNSHLVILGSHAEKLPSHEKKTKGNILNSMIDGHIVKGITYAGHIIIDCRYAVSSSMSQLRSILSHSVKSTRSQDRISTALHTFLVFLLDKFRNAGAVTYSEVSEQLRQCINDRQYVYLESAKSSDPLEMCNELSRRGNILFMRNSECVEKSWIVFDKASLLSKVNGVIFAPEGFKEYQDLSSRSGLVPQSKLASLFPDLDISMITQFLCHLEYCHEVTDQEVLSLLHSVQSPSAEKERLLFFPGLVHLNIPKDIWQSNKIFVYHSGWLLKCSKPEQYFSSRFLQVLLLRLAYSLAFAPCTVVNCVLPRDFQVWKCGISWQSTSGIEVLVEVIDQKQVVAVMRCSKRSLTELLKTRSSIIQRVLNAKRMLCPAVEVEEKFLCPESIATYPVDTATPSKCVSIEAVAKTVVETGEFVINEAKQMLELNSLFYCEPYANLGIDVLQRLRSFSPNQTNDSSVDSIAKLLHRNITRALLTLVPPPDQPSTILEALCPPNMDIKTMRCQVDQFSIFVGRHPLDLCTARNIPLPLQSSASLSTCSVDTPFTLRKPEYHELDMLKYQGKVVKVIHTVAHQWEQFATRLHFEFCDIKRIEKECNFQLVEACHQVVGEWLSGKGRQPTSWSTVIEVLNEIELSQLAKDLTNMFEARGR